MVNVVASRVDVSTMMVKMATMVVKLVSQNGQLLSLAKVLSAKDIPQVVVQVQHLHLPHPFQ